MESLVQETDPEFCLLIERASRGIDFLNVEFPNRHFLYWSEIQTKFALGDTNYISPIVE